LYEIYSWLVWHTYAFFEIPPPPLLTQLLSPLLPSPPTKTSLLPPAQQTPNPSMMRSSAGAGGLREWKQGVCYKKRCRNKGVSHEVGGSGGSVSCDTCIRTRIPTCICTCLLTLTEVHTHWTHMHVCRIANDDMRWSGSASVVSWVVSLAPVLYRHESLAALQSACPQVKIRASSHVTGWAVYPSAISALAGREVSCACARAHVCMHACACLCGCVIHKLVHPYN
jgi:hypothetical protein